ncbi:armadillo repeat-containing protein 8 isoform X3 [Aplysia californica]|uniref:Armadillo repeat-containing protein 8 isoform X3 n=1 Tax=Aplysia californica TaxID=6500 RepID=A0ABM1ACI5_APLCA|nr:armadillo repeat-containing protein 8 isoform X3 [Aplysia californica]
MPTGFRRDSPSSVAIMEVDMDSRPVFVDSQLLSRRAYIATLLNDEVSDEWPSAILQLKNDVIGSNNEKDISMRHGLVPRLLKWLETEYGGPHFQTEVAVVLGSMAMGKANTTEFLMENKAVPIVLKSLTNISRMYTEGLVRCLRYIFKHSAAHSDYLFEENRFGNTYIPHLLSLLPVSPKCQEHIITVLERACQTKEHQQVLLESGAVSVLAPMLWGPYHIQMPTLLCFGKLCYKNPDVCAAVIKEHDTKEAFVNLMARDKPSEMQIEAAKVLTYLHRGGAIPSSDFVISRKTLGTLVRMCKRDRPLMQNVHAAETLACLIEKDVGLQEIASITDHVISTLANYLQFKDVKKMSANSNQEVDWGSEMKRAAFLAFASLTANDEDIREKVIKQDCFIEQVQASLLSDNQLEVIASLKCLHSLTRSVQQIRTVLHDSSVWKPIVDILFQVFSSASEELLGLDKEVGAQGGSPETREKVLLAIGCMCNLALEFSPSREPDAGDKIIFAIAMLEYNAVELLSELSQSQDAALRFNATWCLMSLAYGSGEQLRVSLISCLTADVLVPRLEDELVTIREKALGIVRNLLTTKHAVLTPHVTIFHKPRQSIDHAVKSLGSSVIEAVFNNIRNPSMPPEVIEQALCVVSNMVDGPSCKAHIISKTEDINSVLQHLKSDNEDLQLPVLQFISNLIHTIDDDHGSFPRAGSYQRMLTLKSMGVPQMLESLIGTSTAEVEKRVHETLKSFA